MAQQRPLAAFASRDFRLIWIGNLVSLTGTEMSRAAVAWQVYQVTGDPLALGMIGAARLIPMVLLALGAGVLADAFDRRKLLIGAQVALLICSLTLAVSTSLDVVTIWLIYAITALAGAASTIGLPARQALIPSLVPREHLAGALSLNITAMHLATVLGPTVSGLIIANSGVGPVYWLDAASFIVLISTLLLMSPRPLEVQQRDVSLRAVVDGLQFIRRNKLIWSSMLLDFLATFFSAATTLIPLFAEEILQVGPEGMGLLFAAPSAGAVIASIVISWSGVGRRQGPLLLWSVVIFGLSTIVFGLSNWFWLSLLLLAINGAADTVSMVVRGTIRNLETPDTMRGRMVAINMLFFAGGPQLGEIEAGVAARLLGGPLSVALGGVACVAMTGLLAVATPELRRYTDGTRHAASPDQAVCTPSSP